MIPSKFHRLRHVSIVAAAIFFTAIELVAQPADAGSIAGRVTSREGAVLARATIAITMGVVTVRAMAANDGTFLLNGLAPGTHTIGVTHVGFAPFTSQVLVRPGMTERIEIILDERLSGSMVLVTAERVASRPWLSTTAMKTTTPLIETPASVQIVTEERLEQQRVERVSEAFDYMTGINSGSATRAQGYLLRGFAVDDRFIPYQVDGISGGVWRQHEPPAALIQRIEYLKGPSSTLYGITQLGGVINYVTKKPMSAAQSSIELRHSSYASIESPYGARNSASVTADMTGPVDEERTLLYRLIASHANNTSYRDDVDEQSLDILPEITWHPSETTQITTSLNVNVDKGRWDEYLPVPSRDLSKVPDISARLNGPTDNYWDYGWGLGVIARQTLSDRWVVRSVARHTERIDGRKLSEFAGLKADNVTMKRNWRDQFNERYYSYVDLTAEGKLETGSIAHTLVAGATLGNEKIHFDRRNMQSDSTLDIDIYTPVHTENPLVPAKPGFNRFWNNLYVGGYLQDQISLLEIVRLSAGVQYTSATTKHEERRSGVGFDKYDAGFSPRVGLLLLPVEGLSIYGSYSTSFSPTNAERENAEGTIDFEPEVGRQIETGVKFELLDGTIAGTGAAFQIVYDNALSATGGRNANGNTIYVQTGESRSRGVEIELALAPVPGISLTSGYSYTDARVMADTVAARVGKRLPYVPYNTASAWLSVEPPVDALEGLQLGLGVTYTGERPTEFPAANGALLFLPGYARLDAGLSYDFGGATLALNVTNLLDARYWASGGSSRIVPGTPRSVRTTLHVHM
jgi:iron complex outermembrane recepter protein